jgi:carbonic anhydrase/acetyltransferase-like protein (isoleucine patch superfamily)
MPLISFDGVAPEIADGGRCWIAPTATLIGRVRLAIDASVWFGAVLRGDNEPVVVGERSNIQDLCILHTDPGFPVSIGADCTIGHGSIVHGCTIGDNSLVGMGAVVLNGAVVGRNCLIGAGAVIPERREIPDNSLVLGAPGKVIRALDGPQVRALTESAATYVERWKRYRGSAIVG